ncbi:MAG: hypothetical protein AAB597_03725, partial [Patescibacteria group bacterium]
MVSEKWKPRGAEEKPYRARVVSHEANTSIEYGEKTWTTAQTVRDLMQNHLDAETERYFRQITATVFDEQGLTPYLKAGDGAAARLKIDDLLQAAHLFAKHVEDMTPETRMQSEEHLRGLARGLPIKDEVKEGEDFSPHLFLEAVRPLSEERPSVLYEVVDTKTKKSLGLIAHDTLQSEPMYKDTTRYQIEGMKIIDHGAGFDSQLSALYISSKTGKKHLRGKFGEGAKMSELHILRGGASMKMRSAYSAKNGDGILRNRVWQTRPRVQEGLLVSRGVEVEQTGTLDTGSMVSISLREAKENFRREFLDNADPRLGGLSKNIADFRSKKFVYPMPLTEKRLAGVDVSGDGEVQYIQGLRVELAKQAFGYDKPWYSYDFLDSSVLGGRDRNEINADIGNRIGTFWCHTDNSELLEQLVKTAVHGTQGSTKDPGSSSELSTLSSMLYAEGGKMQTHDNNGPTTIEVGRVQKILDEALLKELGLESGVTTLIASAKDYRDARNEKAFSYADNKDYIIKTTAGDFSNRVLRSFAARLPRTYTLLTLDDIEGMIYKDKKDRETKTEKDGKVIESPLEQEMRKVFTAATASVNSLIRAAGKNPITFRLNFGRADREPQDFEDEKESIQGHDFPREGEDCPVTLSWGEGGEVLVYIDAHNISDPRHTDPRSVQRQIEIYLLNASSGHLENIGDQTEALKKSQRFLDALITKLIPENSTLLRAIPGSFEHAKDPAVFFRLMEATLNETGTKLEKEKEQYETYRKALETHLTFPEAQALQKSFENLDAYAANRIINSRVFLNDDILTHYNSEKKMWEEQRFTEMRLVTRWNGLPVYTLRDGRYFIPAPMEGGAVLSKGEGKKREYTFSEGNTLLHIGQFDVRFENYHHKKVSAHPAGLVISKMDGHISEEEEYVKKQLAEYSYYPKGVFSRGGRIAEGVSATAIPIEYGENEWNNPVRVFQDIIQNHIDASEGAPVRLSFEVEREGERLWVEESELFSSDSYASVKVTGLKIMDGGRGYYPNEIATMGASSKKSPLFAGKYGEGQKMIAAAALRNNLELTYQSTVQNDAETRSWSAQAVSEARSVALDGVEVEKKLVAFEVAPTALQDAGSTTTLRLPLQITPEQEKRWADWVSIIDPRQRDSKSGAGGLARYVRQLRLPGSERVHTVGSISVLLNEPGAVYENGLRINPQAESGRSLSLGYDVPEIVTTRERNSFNADRLKHYIQHALSHTTNPAVIDKVLQKIASGGSKTLDTDIGLIFSEYDSAAPLWAERARQIWPGYAVHSSEKTAEDIHGDDGWFGPTSGVEEARQRERAENALRFKANLNHLDKGKLLDVPERSYRGFSNILPTAESLLKKLETTIVPASPAIKRVLGEVVAESANIFNS